MLGRVVAEQIPVLAAQCSLEFGESLHLFFLERKNLLLKRPNFFLQAIEGVEDLFLGHGKKQYEWGVSAGVNI